MVFYSSIEMIIWFLSFSLLIWCITLIDLHIMKNPCIPEINPAWSWCMSFLMYCWILFAKILLRIFASMSISDWPVVSFFCVVFVWFWYQGNGGLVEWVWKCPSSAIFWKSFRRIGIKLFCKCLIEFSCEAIWSWAFVFGGDFWPELQFQWL